MPLGTDVGFSPVNIVLDGVLHRTVARHLFSAHVYCVQTVAISSTAELLYCYEFRTAQLCYC